MKIDSAKTSIRRGVVIGIVNRGVKGYCYAFREKDYDNKGNVKNGAAVSLGGSSNFFWDLLQNGIQEYSHEDLRAIGYNEADFNIAKKVLDRVIKDHNLIKK